MTELTIKDDEDVIEEYLKKNGKNENKMSAEMDSNATKMIKELQDKIARLRAINYDSTSSSSAEVNQTHPKDKTWEAIDDQKKHPELHTGKAEIV